MFTPSLATLSPYQHHIYIDPYDQELHIPCFCESIAFGANHWPAVFRLAIMLIGLCGGQNTISLSY